MNDMHEGRDGGEVEYTYDEENAFLGFLKRPRIMLLLLAGWSILGALAQTFTDNQVFSDIPSNTDGTKGNIDGLFAGLTFGWEGIALGAVYLYCFRNPARYPKVFWLAAIQMGALTVSILYHWLIADTYTIESIIVPLAGTLMLDFLVFVHLFGGDEDDEVVAKT